MRPACEEGAVSMCMHACLVMAVPASMTKLRCGNKADICTACSLMMLMLVDKGCRFCEEVEPWTGQASPRLGCMLKFAGPC